MKPKAGVLRQECGVGIIELRVDGETLWLQSPSATDTPLADADFEALEESLKAKVQGTPCIINVGPRWLVAALAGADAVAALVPDMQVLAQLSDRLSIGGVTVYGASSDGQSAIHVRSFAPAHGIAEDPVCGSGNISVAAYLRKTGQMEHVGARYTARQGMQLGRDGRVSVRIEGDRIYLGGSAVTCVDGSVQVPSH